MMEQRTLFNEHPESASVQELKSLLGRVLEKAAPLAPLETPEAEPAGALPSGRPPVATPIDPLADRLKRLCEPLGPQEPGEQPNPQIPRAQRDAAVCRNLSIVEAALKASMNEIADEMIPLDRQTSAFIEHSLSRRGRVNSNE